jgi:Pumilio-family RNA binding repeat
MCGKASERVGEMGGKRVEKEHYGEEALYVPGELEDGEEKETVDLISEAFGEIRCSVWKTKNLVDRIEEDHPLHKSTEYRNPEGMQKALSPIGKEALDRMKSRAYICLADERIQREEREREKEPERKSPFVEEMLAFAKRRDIPTAGGLISSISKDQEGSRFIQKKLDTATREEVESTFQEIKKRLNDLMTDLFGNYVVQKFLEIGSREQRKEIFSAMEKIVIPLSLHMYGCRVVQKALECEDINLGIVSHLKGHVVELVCDQNGNHVIQKCVEYIDADFVIKEFELDAVNLSRHRYGCRVIQRIFENSSNCEDAVRKIIEKTPLLVEDQYGNYVIQHILEHGVESDKRKIMKKLTGKMGEYSIHKFASNVVEKCVLFGSGCERRQMLEAILESDSGVPRAVSMACDKFGNYVIQRMLDVLPETEKGRLVKLLRSSLAELKKSTYSKCIVARLGSQ